MSFLPAPTPAEVVTESRLRPEQVDIKYLDADLQSDAAARIARKTDWVESKVLGVFSRAQWDAQDAETKERRESLLNEAIKTLSVASLFGSAGYLRRGFWERAQEQKAEGVEIVNSVLGEINRDNGNEDDGLKLVTLDFSAQPVLDEYAQ